MMAGVFNTLNESNAENSGVLQKQLIRVESNIKKLTDKYVQGTINKELFDQTLLRYTEEKREIEKQLSNCGNQLSNLDEYIVYSLQLCNYLSEIWEKPNWEVKQKIQDLVFPEGVRFIKKINDYRTPLLNSFFAAIACLSNDLSKNKSGTTNINIDNSAWVESEDLKSNSFLEDLNKISVLKQYLSI
jgi:hypothetical protein